MGVDSAHMADEFTDLVGELASIFSNEGGAIVLLRAAGFPKERVPKFTNALVYWTEIVEAAKNGVLNGILPLSMAAAALYPHNEVFARYQNTADIKNDRVAYKITIKIECMTMVELGELLAKIQQSAGDDSISLEKIEKGSIILTLRMSAETAARLSDLVDRGVLSDHVGYRVSGSSEERGRQLRLLSTVIDRERVLERKLERSPEREQEQDRKLERVLGQDQQRERERERELGPEGYADKGQGRGPLSELTLERTPQRVPRSQFRPIEPEAHSAGHVCSGVSGATTQPAQGVTYAQGQSMSELPDFELLNRWRAGDCMGGELLFERYYDGVHRFFATKIKEDVTDLVQATFMGCVEAKERFDGRNSSTFKAYLFGIARFKLFEFFRERRRDAHLSALDSVSMSIGDIGGSLKTWLHDKYNHHLLRRALPRIPLDFQLLLELYLWENFTAQQLALVMRIPEDVVRSRFRRAKELLRAEIVRAASTPAEGTETLDSISGWCLDMQEKRDKEYPELKWAK